MFFDPLRNMALNFTPLLFVWGGGTEVWLMTGDKSAGNGDTVAGACISALHISMFTAKVLQDNWSFALEL